MLTTALAYARIYRLRVRTLPRTGWYCGQILACRDYSRRLYALVRRWRRTGTLRLPPGQGRLFR